MKKRMFAALLAVSMMIGMTACGSDNSSAGNSASGSSTETAKSDNAGSDSSYDVLNVGTMALTCGIPVLYAEEQGYFKDAGLNVNIEILQQALQSTRQLLQTRLMSLFRDSLLFTLLRMQIVAGLQM